MKTRAFVLLGVLCVLFLGLLSAKAPAAGRHTGDVIGTVSVGDRPVADAVVVIEGKSRTGRDVLLRTRTDRRGHFSFVDVPVGQYLVSAAKRGVGRDGQRVKIEAGQTIRVQLDLH